MNDIPSAPKNPKKVCRIDAELLNVPGSVEATSSWRIFRIMAEFVNAFELLRKIDLAATIYGSARSPEESPSGREAHRLGAMLAKEGYTIITGGGGGVMRAANRGAKEVGGQSIGLNIRLPEEQQLNDFVTDSATFQHFFTRKVALAFASEVYIYFPGGFGTLDEFFEILTLVQTKKIQPVPIILVGQDFWEPLVAWMNTTLKDKYQTINAHDLSLFHVVKSADEAHELVNYLVPKERC